MIYPVLTDAQMKRSQRFFIGFNLLNGLGYMCVGDMVMTLLGNRLGFPDVVFTTFGAFFNLGCIWIPLGKIAAQHWGAARTQSNFWLWRNLASIMMDSCAIWGFFGHLYIAIAFFLAGGFLFCACRSAGGVMTNTLVGNITHENERGKLLAFASMSHNIVTAFVIISLTLLLHRVERFGNTTAIWALFAIILFGAGCGILSAICMRCVDESESIREAAKKPLITDGWVCLKSSAFRRMVTAQICFSVAMALTFSINMLVLKRGFQISDSMALAINFLGSLLCVALARPAAWLGDKIGPRKGLIVGYSFNFLLILFWQLVPGEFHWLTVVILFFLTSSCSMCCGICQGQYFLKCIPVEHQPSAATLQSLINGILTGVIVMGLTAFLWKGCDWILGPGISMARYRLFVLLGLPFVALGFIGIWRQKEV